MKPSSPSFLQILSPPFRYRRQKTKALTRACAVTIRRGKQRMSTLSFISTEQGAHTMKNKSKAKVCVCVRVPWNPLRRSSPRYRITGNKQGSLPPGQKTLAMMKKYYSPHSNVGCGANTTKHTKEKQMKMSAFTSTSEKSATPNFLFRVEV